MDTSHFFELLFENSKYKGIMCTDLNGIIMSVNAAAEKITGYKKDELLGANVEILFTADDRLARRPEAERQKVLSAGAANDENYLKRKSGEAIWVAGDSPLTGGI
jgi:PAS domain S-box-containing protein